jgi:hypothetical protein
MKVLKQLIKSNKSHNKYRSGKLQPANRTDVTLESGCARLLAALGSTDSHKKELPKEGQVLLH